MVRWRQRYSAGGGDGLGGRGCGANGGGGDGDAGGLSGGGESERGFRQSAAWRKEPWTRGLHNQTAPIAAGAPLALRGCLRTGLSSNGARSGACLGSVSGGKGGVGRRERTPHVGGEMGLCPMKKKLMKKTLSPPPRHKSRLL